MWYWFKDSPVESIPEGAIGFVYKIQNMITGKCYIGKKLFYKKVTKKPLKGQKKKRRSIQESDWREYTGSCTELNEDIAKLGIENFSKTILKVCATRGDLSYEEAKTQFDLDVLRRDDYYNGIIQCRINKKHLSKVDRQTR